MGHPSGRHVIAQRPPAHSDDRPTMPRRWRGIVASALLLTASGVGASGLAGCGSDDEAASVEVLSTLRPTKAMVARDAGIAFPPSTDGFRAARVGGDLHVSFTIDADDADAFDERSGLHLAAGKRVITHSSPLWELNPSGEISGGASADSAVKRTVEIVTPAVDTDPLQVRLVISPAPSE